MKVFYRFTILLTIISLITACGGRSARRSASSEEQITTQGTTTVAANADIDVTETPVNEYKINVYLENSGSMNGFINQNSEFQDAFQRLTALLKHHYEESNLSMNYINTNIHPRPKPTNVDLLDFAEQLVQPQQFRSVGNVGSTDLNNIIDMILTEIENDEISILVSDCIYSISGSGITTSMLATCKNKTFSHFLAKSNTFSDLSTLIIAMNSSFSGNYWDYQHPSGAASQVLNCSRPYYICVFGSSSAVNNFNEKISFEELNGYADRLLLTTVDKISLAYNTLSTSYKAGQFRMRAENTLSDLRKSGDGRFEFAIAANMANMPMTDVEKMNISNYETSNPNYAVNSVIPIVDNMPGINPNDRSTINRIKATHILCVSNSGPLSPTNLQIKVKNTLPTWVSNQSSIDDTQIGVDDDEQAKTFGLEYFVKGMFDAYRENTPEKDYLKTLQVEIK